MPHKRDARAAALHMCTSWRDQWVYINNPWRRKQRSSLGLCWVRTKTVKRFQIVPSVFVRKFLRKPQTKNTPGDAYFSFRNETQQLVCSIPQLWKVILLNAKRVSVIILHKKKTVSLSTDVGHSFLHFRDRFHAMPDWAQKTTKINKTKKTKHG